MQVGKDDEAQGDTEDTEHTEDDGELAWWPCTIPTVAAFEGFSLTRLRFDLRPEPAPQAVCREGAHPIGLPTANVRRGH